MTNEKVIEKNIKKNSMFYYLFVSSAIQIIMILSLIGILSLVYYKYSDYFSPSKRWNLEKIYEDFKALGEIETLKQNTLPEGVFFEILNRKNPYSKYFSYSRDIGESELNEQNNEILPDENLFDIDNSKFDDSDSDVENEEFDDSEDFSDVVPFENQENIEFPVIEEAAPIDLNETTENSTVNHGAALEDFDMETIKYQPKNSDDILIIYVPQKVKKDAQMSFLFGIVGVFIVLLLILLTIYSYFTASKFIKPLQKIMDGVSTISDGDYEHTISHNIKNFELNNLRNEINSMVNKINSEINAREEIEKNRKRLILDISHDLKTPLTNILGYIETLEDYEDLSDEAIAKYMGIIKRSGKKANKLIVDLFSFSQMDSPDYNMQLIREDINEFLRNLFLQYIDELEENAMDYEIDIPESELFVNLNSNMLDRAIANLIINSIKYSGEGSTLSLIAVKEDSYAKVIVEDNGVGVPEEFRKDIFEPFTRADESRNSKTGGSGLGLSIGRKIIAKHGGSIELDNSYNDGCRFIIKLPITK